MHGRAEELFAGPGAMRARCRVFDWTSTPLGPVEDWPATLCHAIGIVMASPRPMWIGWGVDLIQIYNDACLPFSDRHPASLGRAARDTWADIWHLAGGDLERVRDGGPAVHAEDRRIPYLRDHQFQEALRGVTHSPIPDASAPRGVGGVLSMAVEGARTEASLRESEERYFTLFDSIDEGYCTIEVLVDTDDQPYDYRFLEANPAFTRQTGLTSAVGRTVRELVPGHETFWYDIYGEIARTGIARRFEHQAAALGRFYDVYAFRIGDPADRRVAVLFNDVSDRKVRERQQAYLLMELRVLNEKLEDRVRARTTEIDALFARLVTAQEEERHRVARDIHDQLGQTMTALRMNLDALQIKARAHPAIGEQTERARRLAEEADQAIDFLTWDLRPPALDLGLAAAVRSLVTGWSQRFSIAADVIVPDDDVRLAPDAEANLYRLAQEALHNVLKHARATHVSVVLEHTDRQLVLVIEDDGRGFNPAALRAAGEDTGFGLVSMRERAVLAGGHLEVESVPGAGTSIFVRIPIPSIAEEPAR